MPMTPEEAKLLDIETAWTRYIWARAQIRILGENPAMTKLAEESLEEWLSLKAAKPHLASAVRAIAR